VKYAYDDSNNIRLERGSTRTVILMKRHAFKLPTLSSWRRFLQGLLANMQEVNWSRIDSPYLCPVLFHPPLGFLVVMPRCASIDSIKTGSMEAENWRDKGSYLIPVEYKADSFGYYGGGIVAIDYGQGY
jgi:hypothetical protein